MVTYEPFSIVVVPFPFTDKFKTKKRPALVLSNKNHQHETKHITLLMITSAKHSVWESDYEIQYLKSTGLTSPSIVRQKLFTIDIRFIINSLGKLIERDRKSVEETLITHLNIHF